MLEMSLNGISLQREYKLLKGRNKNNKEQERFNEISKIIENKMARNKLGIGEGCLTEDICYDALNRHFHKWANGQTLVDWKYNQVLHVEGGIYELGNLRFVCDRYGNNIMEIIVDCGYEYCGNGCPYCGGDDYETHPKKLLYAFDEIYAEIDTYYSVKSFIRDFYDFITDWDFRNETIEVIDDTYFNPSDYF